MKNWKHERSRHSAGKWLWLALLLVFCVGWYVFFTSRARHEAVFFSLLCGSLSLATIWAIRGLFYSENEEALDHAVQKREPVDGKWTAAVGTIQPLTPQGALTAPFSGQAAVAYQYWITRFERRTAGPEPSRRYSRNRHLITAYTGRAMVPCEIRTASGGVRIQGMPVLQAPRSTLSDDASRDRAQAYINSTVFEDAFLRQKADSTAEGRKGGSAPVTVREDKRENPGPNLDGWMLDEVVVRPGETVCAYGLYSAADRSLFAPPRETGGRLFALLPGDAAAAKAALRAQRTFLGIVLAVLVGFQLLIAWRAW
ncbi:MAG TPA: hypothetical protein PK843_17510 [bacterium]|mgnify:CR=1 FL=1|nr:hypothetical protein [bacterium]